LDTDEELNVSFIDWQEFGRVNWTKLMQILKETGIDWRERRLISNLYMAFLLLLLCGGGARASQP
jgi:hypothetical protein